MPQDTPHEGLGPFVSEGEFQAGAPGTAYISGNTFPPTKVTYFEVNGRAVFEGDIVLGTVDQVPTTLEEYEAQAGARAVIIPGAQFRWPGAIVPFQINAALPNQQRVRDAITHWEQRTSLRFPERTAANAAQFPNFVEFSDAGGCWSRLGMQGGSQTISLGTGCTTGNAIHEIGHTIGLWHEQSREDRNTFVTINWANIEAGMASQFDQHVTDGDDVGPYDYGSIMHYPRTAFSKNGQETVTPVQAGAQIGQRTALSAGDIAAADFMYPRSKQSSGPVVSWGPNRLDVFVLGADRAVYHKWWNGQAWGPSLTGYENMGGTATSVPQAVAWGQNRIDLFVTGTDSALYHKWWNGSAWGPSLTSYENMGGAVIGNPRIVSWGANRLDVFVVGTDRALYHKWWNGSAWGPSLTSYENMGGACVGQPEVVSWGPNRLDVFVVGTDGALYHKWWNGSAWGPSLTGYENMGGACTSAPRVVSWGPNRLDVFVTGTDGAVYHKWFNGSSWGPSLTGYERMGGTVIGQPEAVAWGPNRLDLFVIGTDKSLFHKWWNGSAWGPSLTGYEGQGGSATSDPRVVAWGPNRLDVFLTGTNSALFHKWWNGQAWGPSLTGYENMGGVVTSFDAASADAQERRSDTLQRDTD